MMRLVWIGAGWISLGLGLLGAALPVLPTVPFLILAAFCFSRSSERLHHWMMTHPKFGGPLRDWSERGAISRRAKAMAVLTLAASFGIALLAGLPPVALIAQAVVMGAVAAFILTRPDA